jgi:DNA-binding GntR family transcriptional regulator
MSVCATVSAASLSPSGAVGPQLLQQLRGQILRGELAPGSRLSEAEVAAAFGISRQPVREAFIKLAEDSLLGIRPQRGTYVSRIKIDSVLAARFVREAVEADIVRIVAANPPDALLADLDELVTSQAKAVEQADPEEFIALDEAFHRHLAEAAGQASGWDILQPLKTQMDRVRHLNVRRFPQVVLLGQHRAILAAIKEQDAGRAETLMRNHLRQILIDLPVVAAELPDFFEPSGGGATPGASVT